jgi:hypothetical protein
MKLIACFGLACLLSGCVHSSQQSAFEVYNACSSQTSSFVAMVECGKRNRNAACQKENTCSETGNAFVQYADSLALSVKNKEMTEAQALRQFAEYQTKVVGDNQRDRAMIAAGEASRPRTNTTCQRIGNTVNCY